MVPQTRLTACTAILLAVAGCSAETGGGGPETRSDPVAELDIPLMATDAVPSGVLAQVIASPAEGSSYAFISVAPGTLQTGHSISLTNTANDASVAVELSEGGFDPVPIEAASGDTIRVDILSAEASVIETGVIIIPVDIPPIIVRSDPPKRRTSVPLNAIMTLVFSEPIEPSTVTAENIVLAGPGGPVATQLELSSNGTTVRVDPNDDLMLATSYELSVGTGITDLSGSSLQSEDVISFTTSDEEPFAIKLLPDTLTIPVGSYSGFLVIADSGQTVINVFPDSSLTWSTSDESVVSVDWVGSVGGESIGEAYVSVERDGEVDSALVVVTESPPPGPFAVFPDGWSAPVGVEVQFEISHPEGTEEPAVTWSSTDESIVTIDSTGMAATISPGLAYVVATDGTDTDSAEVEVVEDTPEEADPYVVIPNSLILEIGSSFELWLGGAEDGTYPPFTWTSADSSIASVSEDGVVTALTQGETFIGAIFEDGSGAWNVVTVVDIGGLGTMTLSPAEIELSVGDTIHFEVTLDSTAAALYGDRYPSTWSMMSSGPGMVLETNSELGVGTYVAVGEGVATVTAHIEALRGEAHVEVK